MSEIVITSGFPAGGKSTITQAYVDKGYRRFNRDLMGGSLDGVAAAVKTALSVRRPGVERPNIIVDNTYITVASRASIIEVAKSCNVPIKCLWVTTTLEDCAFNNCLRMIRKYGKVLSPEELKKSKDPNALPPGALFGARKEFQKPTVAEGFASVELVPFKRVWDSSYVNKALILDFDGCLRITRSGSHFPVSPSDVLVLIGRTPILKDYEKRGYRLLGASNQSGIGKGDLTEQQAIDCFEETCRQLGVKIEYTFCPHRVPPISCFCRKPGVAMGAQFIEKYKLKPSDCLFVGDMTTDKTFATRCGFQFADSGDFFK